jgi:hypothetical protein
MPHPTEESKSGHPLLVRPEGTPAPGRAPDPLQRRASLIPEFGPEPTTLGLIIRDGIPKIVARRSEELDRHG